MAEVVVITGASSGIGRAAARQLADRGSRVFDLSRSEKPQAGVTHIGCDVTDAESVSAAFARLKNEVDKIDLLICCAGMGVAGAVEFTTDEEMHRQFEVNFFGTVRVVREALPLMRGDLTSMLGEDNGSNPATSESGKHFKRIVLVGSMAGIFAIPYQAMYSASKAAIHNFAMSLANEVKGQGIEVTCFEPGDVHTGFTAARQSSLRGLDLYPYMKRSIAQMEHDEATGMPAEQCAAKLVHAATSHRNKLYHTMDLISWLEKLANRLAPSGVIKKVVGLLYKA